jgi:hypothetical protein
MRARADRIAAVVVAVASSACTFLSGVEGLELRQGGPPADAGPDDAADPPDASANDTGGGTACSTALECQDERCKADLPDPRIATQVGSVLGVTATCEGGAPRVVNPGPSRYYTTDVRCTLSPQPTSAAVSSFVSRMNADGWFGYSTRQEGAELVVIGESTTRLCNSY